MIARIICYSDLIVVALLFLGLAYRMFSDGFTTSGVIVFSIISLVLGAIAWEKHQEDKLWEVLIKGLFLFLFLTFLYLIGFDGGCYEDCARGRS